MTGLVAAMQDTTSDGVRLVSTYPPQTLTATGYRRTGTLKRSWSPDVSVSGIRITGIVGSNGNIAPYNLEVQGPVQNRVFKSAGWPNEADLKQQMERDLSIRANAVFAAI